MASMELRANVFDKLNYLLDNDEAMEQLDSYLLRLKKKMAKAEKAEKSLPPYTMEELNARIDEAEAEEEAGIAGVPHEQVMQRMRKALSWLR